MILLTIFCDFTPGCNFADTGGLSVLFFQNSLFSPKRIREVRLKIIHYVTLYG